MLSPQANLYGGDCLDFLTTLKPGSAQAVITDPPFGTGTAEWDTDPDPLVWDELQRLCPHGPIAIIGYAKQLVRWSRFFEMELIGKIVWHKYNEPVPSGGLTRIHQDIYIFGKSLSQIRADKAREKYEYDPSVHKFFSSGGNNPLAKRITKNGKKPPHPDGRRATDLWRIPVPHHGFNAHLRQHPNQKPLDLMKRLVLLLSDEGNTVLDPYMGSGTTGQAAIALGRKFIGCELMPEYYNVARKNIGAVEAQPLLITGAGLQC